MNGHKFVQQQFYQIMLCAFCNDFLLNALGYQCEDCRYTCHKKCYEKVVTKCISKSNTGVCLSVQQVGFLPNNHTRMATKRKLTIAFHIDLSLSPTWVPTGAATVATCFPLVARTPAGVPNAALLVTQIVLISFRISVACRWRQRMSFFGIGETLTSNE